MPPWDHRFDKVFVVVLPSCLCGGYYQRHQPRALCTTTSVHGSFAPAELCCLCPRRSYDPIRQSRRLPQTSQDAWLYHGSFPTTWSGLPPRPSLLCDNAPSLRATTPTPGGGVSAYFRYFLTPTGLPQSNNGSAPPYIPTPVSVGGNFRRCSVRFMLRPAWLLAFLDWSDLTELVGRRRRLRPSLPQRRSLTSRVGYDYTASPDRYCGRTSTGWSAAVTGCALLRSQFPLFASLGRCSPPGVCGSAGRSVLTAAGALSCAFWLQCLSLLRWVKVTMAQPHLRLRCP
jgi:hypothetical protein